MIRDEFLGLDDVGVLTDWIADRLEGRILLNFCHSQQQHVYPFFQDALNAYQWPDRLTTIPIPLGAPIVLPRYSTFHTNNQILEQLQHGLGAAIDDDPAGICEWAIAVVIWGGVAYARNGGNSGWLLALTNPSSPPASCLRPSPHGIA
jgi:hypothetical protein